MKWGMFVCCAAMVIACTPYSEPPPNTDPAGYVPASPPIINTRGVRELSSNIGEGGFDLNMHSGTYYNPNLKDCSNAVADEGKKWAIEKGFTVLSDDESAGHIQCHFGSNALSGFYELLYRWDSAKREASLSFVFYTLRNAAQQPPMSDDDVNSLSFRLNKALSCAN